MTEGQQGLANRSFAAAAAAAAAAAVHFCVLAN
jgi:hypothetical protein